MKTIIGVISHKKYNMPSNPIYLPIEVNGINHDKHFYSNHDDLGINISEKNPSFCELTGIYYVYKNLDYDILGFVHYRRLFVKKGKKNISNVLDENSIINMLNKTNFILPKKRNYFIESNYKHYASAHKVEALDKLGEVIKEFYPEYYPSYVKQMKSTKCHLFNMFIAKKEDAEKYLDFLFDCLFKVEERINLDEYKGYDKRVFGFLAERMIDIYIDANKLTYTDCNYMFTEKQNMVKKIINCLKRHFEKNRDTSVQ